MRLVVVKVNWKQIWRKVPVAAGMVHPALPMHASRVREFLHCA